jgi:hypothetical protein
MTENNFEPKYRTMNPELEDLLKSGLDLREGMMVLIDSPELRYPDLSDAEAVLDYTRKFAKWCEVTQLSWNDGLVEFIGLYGDMTKRLISVSVTHAWFVMKDSIPAEIEPATGLKISDLPNPEQLELDYAEPVRRYETRVRDEDLFNDGLAVDVFEAGKAEPVASYRFNDAQLAEMSEADLRNEVFYPKNTRPETSEQDWWRDHTESTMLKSTQERLKAQTTGEIPAGAVRSFCGILDCKVVHYDFAVVAGLDEFKNAPPTPNPFSASIHEKIAGASMGRYGQITRVPGGSYEPTQIAEPAGTVYKSSSEYKPATDDSEEDKTTEAKFFAPPKRIQALDADPNI